MSYPLVRQLQLPKLEIFLLFMAIGASLIAWSPQRYFAWSRTLIPTDYPAQLSNDHFTGGNSQSSWLEQRKHIWQCVSGESAPRYCTYSLDLHGSENRGLPLAQFHSMKVKIFYRGEAQTLRLTLRNATQPYYNASDWTSTQYNQVDLPTAQLDEGVLITPDVFTVANWWLAQKKFGEKSTQPEFNQVMYLEIQVGGQNKGEKHVVQLLEVEWQGAKFTSEQVYRALIFGWVFLVFVLLIIRYVRLRLNLARKKKKQAELLKLNNALELQNKEFSEVARTDSLTGVLNRLGLRDEVYEKMAVWEAKNISLSLVMIDLDHFKKINDTYGHDVGDDVIKKSADVFLKNIRGSDLIARWGGEEFLLLCQNTSLSAAKLIAEGLREKLSELAVAPNLVVTASFGVASGSVREFNRLHTLADKALYQAKSEGRNRVIAYASSE